MLENLFKRELSREESLSKFKETAQELMEATNDERDYVKLDRAIDKIDLVIEGIHKDREKQKKLEGYIGNIFDTTELESIRDKWDYKFIAKCGYQSVKIYSLGVLSGIGQLVFWDKRFREHANFFYDAAKEIGDVGKEAIKTRKSYDKQIREKELEAKKAEEQKYDPKQDEKITSIITEMEVKYK